MERPLISYILFAYNQENYIRHAVQSALAQDYSPLEIILTDDCSNDATFKLLKKELDQYKGPHKCILNRNESNLGLAEHINRAFELTTGGFIVMAAGDDISTPNRVSALAEKWQDENNPVDCVVSYFEDMYEDGTLTGEIIKDVIYLPNPKQHVYRWACGATGACAGYDRKIFNKYGSLARDIVAEDNVLPFRAWLDRGIGVVEEPLVKHRTHEKSIYFIHRNVDKFKRSSKRSELRRTALLGNLAKHRDWERSWQIAGGKSIDRKVEKEMKQAIGLLEIEARAFSANRAQALFLAIKALFYRVGLKSCARITLRHVLRVH